MQKLNKNAPKNISYNEMLESFATFSNINTRSNGMNCTPWSYSSISPDSSRSLSHQVLNPRLECKQELQNRFDEEYEKRGLNYLNNLNSSGKYVVRDEMTLFSNIMEKDSNFVVEFIKSSITDLNLKDFWVNNVLISLYLRGAKSTLDKVIDECFDNFSKETMNDFLTFLVSSKYCQSDDYVNKLISTLIWKLGEDVLNKQDDFGNTIIMHTLENVSVLKHLLKTTKIDLEVENLCGNNPVSYCVQSGSDQSLVVLIDFMKSNYTKEKTEKILNHKNFLQQTPLILALDNSGSLQMIKTLVNTGLVDINIPNYEGKTPLLISIESNCEDIANYFMSNKNINYDCPDNFGNTPIIRAI